MTADKGTTKIGYENRNRQVVIEATGLPGNDFFQKVYVLRCGICGREYGANGSDIWDRRCPGCQGGATGLSYRSGDCINGSGTVVIA